MTGERRLPRYPIFVPSKGRAEHCLTARFLTADRVPFRLVVEAPEEHAYRAVFPDADVVVCPVADGRGVLPVRNWIRDLAIEEGWDRHWQIDDNVYGMRRLVHGRRIPCDSALALRVCEDFTDRYENIGVSGFNYLMFVADETPAPFYLNCHVYSCCLISNRMPYRWRLRYNEDTDLCLQVLSGGLCTVALNAFMAWKITTMTLRGGNTDALYGGDGRLRMAKELERMWPGVVSTTRRWGRPQHVVRGAWSGFDTKLIRRADVDFSALPAVDEYGGRVVQVAPEVRSARVRALIDDAPPE